MRPCERDELPFRDSQFRVDGEMSSINSREANSVSRSTLLSSFLFVLSSVVDVKACGLVPHYITSQGTSCLSLPVDSLPITALELEHDDDRDDHQARG